jgi:putative transposase
VQRFFATVVPWPQLFWLVFRHHLFQPDDVYILAGDEVVVTKAGKTTFGLDRFCSSIYRKAVPSVDFLSLALISTKVSRRFPVSRTDTVRYRDSRVAVRIFALQWQLGRHMFLSVW